MSHLFWEDTKRSYVIFGIAFLVNMALLYGWEVSGQAGPCDRDGMPQSGGGKRKIMSFAY